MLHVEIATGSSARSDLEARLTGRFYTPLKIADRLAATALATGHQPSCVCDPFCGDGRLITAWLRRASVDRSALERLVEIQLWDYDPSALNIARESVAQLLQDLGLSSRVRVVATPGDTFRRVVDESVRVDLLLTNPPWELLKPDSRDAVAMQGPYRDTLRQYAEWLERELPGCKSAAGKAVTGYGVNLARAGAIASARLLRPGAMMLIVLPSSIFADQASSPFRSSLFQRLRVDRVEHYPAEAKLFGSVDQAFVTLQASATGPTSSFTLARFDALLQQVESREHAVGTNWGEPLALNVAGNAEGIAREIAARNPLLELLQVDLRFGLWLGRELDETRLQEAFCGADRGVPFLKGKNVFPFEIKRDSVDFIDPEKRLIPATVSESRIAWRDVSRPNQRRRMHVAFVPRGNVTGNSLGVAYFRTGDPQNLAALLAIMNSLVFELQVRTKLATTHVSQGVLRRCAVPMNCFMDSSERRQVLELLSHRIEAKAEMPEMEVKIAQAYGLTRDEFGSALSAFPKLTADEQAALLRKELWR